MAENRFSCSGNSAAARESYGIESARILDACRDRDCFENARVYLTEEGEELIASTGNVRVKSACISGANIVTEPIQFNSGFCSVDVKFYVTCTCEACVPPGTAQEFEGVAVLQKRVVLYGGESNVNIFRSTGNNNYCTVPDLVCSAKKDPEAVVEVLDPIVLGARILDTKKECHCCCRCCDIPTPITDQLDGTLVEGAAEDEDGRVLAISLGLFSVIRLLRDDQFLIQATEFSLPEKECVSPDADNPCAAFNSIPFPASEFTTTGASVSPYSGGTGKRCCGNS